MYQALGLLWLSESEVIQFPASRRYKAFTEVRYLPEQCLSVGGRMLGMSEKVSLKKSERFLHSHTSGVSHLRELLPILFSPRYACDPPVVLVHREEEGGGHPLHQHHLLHHRHPRAAEPQPLAGNEKAQRLQADTLGSEMGRDTPEAPDGSGQSWVQNPSVLAPPP